ncbi:alpha-keto acid decarboxylase family protein [Clostridium sp. 'White wine YQ']|uniref:alpha-keto acid decarboxylase family protein n=1 Tax=Clostridium sp. 'White wine YQ' TaxID=3027474 RepID=UPI0023671EC5|nr:thiamine pyrophosphate-dependent enzyme [Clostridium sp. 'White wine YQ']MDD7793404.1 thiamine pyrophosphate-binding protein [Clostridium sp. 'White wine YQ']
MSDNTTNSLDLKQTVGYYLFDCLRKEGITEIFGVPGDYNFSLLNILEKYQYINFINCRNELNAGYATDAYARVRGMGALITTFGVGELSACNAIAGSYCESVPVIHIVGAPKTMVQQEHKQMHHTLLNGDFDVFRKVSENITEYNAVITPENATLEIPIAIQKAKENKKPVYLLLATDIVSKKVVKRPINLENKQTNQKNLQSAINHIQQMMNGAKNPLLISGTFVSRYNLQSQVEQIVQKMNLPVATMIMGKGSFDESNKNYIGLYAGSLGSKEVQNKVETCDCILSVGTKWSDYNTGAFTAMLNPLNIIDIQPYYVKVGTAVYENILIKDLLGELLSKVDIKTASVPAVTFPYTENYASLGEDISSKYHYPRFQSMFKENDVIVADAGTFQFGIAELRLPKGATYITQGGWGSIGYGTPAAFGACIADRNRRVILFVGDGSNQMTVQEFSSILSNNCKPIVFLVNNNEYTIEKYLNINEKQTHYNDIPIWDYSKLIEAFGGDAYTAKVYTNKELDDAINQAELQCKDRFCFIEIYAPQMDAPEIVHKMTNVLEQMKS